MIGYPSIVDGFTTASNSDLLAVLNSRPDPVNVGQLMYRVLKQFEPPVVQVWDHIADRLYASADGVVAQDMEAAFLTDTGPVLQLRPRSGQGGVNLLYEVVSDTVGDAALVELLTNDHQRRSFFGLINTAQGFRAKNVNSIFNVMVSQRSATITFNLPVGEGMMAIQNLTPAGQTLCISVSWETARLIFE